MLGMFAKKVLVLTVLIMRTLAGCVAPAAGSAHLVDGAPAPPAADSQVEENLARLRALDVFAVGQLIVEASGAATSCSGPCPAAETALNAAHTKSAARLARLVARAEKAAASPLPDACAQTAIDGNLAALAELRIVRISGLIVPQPAKNPQCTDRPCLADGAAAAAAAAATCARAGKLASIAAAVRGL
jgi:hypothetical protein